MSHETARSHQVAEDLAQEKHCQALRSLPARIPPPGLTTSLRVIASRERKRFLERRTLRQAVATWYEHASMTVGDMIRTAALPVVGGLCSAVILFSIWLVPTYPLHAAQSSVDVPTVLSTEATVHEAGLNVAGGDAVLDVTVDEQGSVVDYAMVSGGDVLQDPTRLHWLKSELPYLRFTPATEFGRPTTSIVRLHLSQIDPGPKPAYVLIVKD